MESEKVVRTQALKYISCEDQNICRLCFCSTKEQEVHFDDNVNVQRTFADETITIMDILLELGLQREPFLPQILCASCATCAISSYLFQKMCHYADNQWKKEIHKLEISLLHSDELKPNIKTLYLNLNENKTTLFTSKKKTVVNTKKDVIVKAIAFLKNRTATREHRKQKVTSNSMCEMCGMSFDSNKVLLKHVQASHPKFRITCQECGKVFLTKTKFTDHRERVHDPKSIRCPKCDRMFSTPRMLDLHNKMHHVGALCKLCFIQLPSRNALRMHLDKHDVHKCDLCNKTFINKHTFKIHGKYCGNPDMKGPQVYCDICKKGYSRKSGLRSHMKVDHGFGKVYPCKWCGKNFDAISRLNMHIVKHTRARNFHCEVCGGKFVTQAALVYHNRLHTGEKPFPCDVCNESFLSASRRLEHKKRKHLGPTEECHLCLVKFTSKFQLKKHLARHTNPSSKLYIPDSTFVDPMKKCIKVEMDVTVS